MRSLKISVAILFICFGASTLYADIYSWRDENGVMNYTNYSPPPDTKIFIKNSEIAQNEAAGQERIEIENSVRVERERQEELENSLLEANRKLEEALENAEGMAEDLERRLQEADRRADAAVKNIENLNNEYCTVVR